MLEINLPTQEDVDRELALRVDWLESRKLAARTAIRQDKWPIEDQNLQEIICDEHEHQREVVAKFGSCEGGCSDRNLRKHEHGHFVCRWTHEPCPRNELAETIELLSILNGGHSE